MHSLFHATLEVSLSSIAENYRRLCARLGSGLCAGVVKANAYGLGADDVSRALYKKGCRYFFVATLEEGVLLRAGGLTAPIYVIAGFTSREDKVLIEHGLHPVLNTPEQLKHWAKLRSNNPAAPSSILQIDTGMRRLGLTPQEVRTLSAKPDVIHKAGVTHYMTHLACADAPAHDMNMEQLNEVRTFLKLLPRRRVSLCNSSGIYLGRKYHFDLARPGCALYGINPTPEKKNPMKGVARLTAPILQIRELDQKRSVGYAATYTGKKGDRIATLGIGYADGWFRHLGNKSFVYVEGVKCPVVGRVSMDMIAADITKVPESKITRQTRAELIGGHIPVDEVAKAAGTIGYEVFSRLGRRVRRIYTEDGQFG